MPRALGKPQGGLARGETVGEVDQRQLELPMGFFLQSKLTITHFTFSHYPESQHTRRRSLQLAALRKHTCCRGPLRTPVIPHLRSQEGEEKVRSVGAHPSALPRLGPLLTDH